MALTLDESYQEGQDQLEKTDGVSFIFDQKIAPYVSDKVIDYHKGPQSGFSIKKDGFDPGCGSCC